MVEADGRPAVLISGEIFGAITSKDEFENYHFRVEFKWGEKRWPPREKAVRDSGVLYHCVGPQGASGAAGISAILFALQESVIPPTLNLENPDPDCDLDYVPRVPREARVRYALANCIGLGSKNSALVLGHA